MKFDVIHPDVPWPYNARVPHSQKRGNGVDKKPKFGGGSDAQYPMMSEQDLIDLGPLVRAVSSPSSIMFMWTTGPQAEFAKELMRAWGFPYKTTGFVWVKTQKSAESRYGKVPMEEFLASLPIYGPGNYTGSNEESVLVAVQEDGDWDYDPVQHCLLGTRQDPKYDAPNPMVSMVPQVVFAPRGKHSAKPVEVIHRIDRMYPAESFNKLEMFARTVQPGWTATGNQVEEPGLKMDIRDALAHLARL